MSCEQCRQGFFGYRHRSDLRTWRYRSVVVGPARHKESSLRRQMGVACRLLGCVLGVVGLESGQACGYKLIDRVIDARDAGMCENRETSGVLHASYDRRRCGNRLGDVERPPPADEALECLSDVCGVAAFHKCFRDVGASDASSVSKCKHFVYGEVIARCTEGFDDVRSAGSALVTESTQALQERLIGVVDEVAKDMHVYSIADRREFYSGNE